MDVYVERDLPGRANHWLSKRCRIAKAQKVSLGASRGGTHASSGGLRTDAPGLREAWTAQRNGLAAFRKTNDAPRCRDRPVEVRDVLDTLSQHCHQSVSFNRCHPVR